MKEELVKHRSHGAEGMGTNFPTNVRKYLGRRMKRTLGRVFRKIVQRASVKTVSSTEIFALNSYFYYRVCHGFRLMKQDDYFWSLSTTFEASITF